MRMVVGLATCRRNEMDRRCGCGTALNLPSQRGDAGYRLMTLNTVLMLGDVAHPRLLACLLLADLFSEGPSERL